jgi:predicted regulator of Ras-like GTPase activity (Roadblock/LC7/MglB family)
MPVMDGLDILAYLSNEHPYLPIIIISGYGTTKTMAQINSTGGLPFYLKPVDFGMIIQNVQQIIFQHDENKTKHCVTLGSFLFLIEMEKKTCLLEIKSESDAGEKTGYLYFDSGTIYDATTKDKGGEKAVIEMITWEDIRITFKALPKKQIKRRITRELTGLIMEGGGDKANAAIPKTAENKAWLSEENAPELPGIDIYTEIEPLEAPAKDSAEADVTTDISDGSVPEAAAGTSTQVLKALMEINGVDACVIIGKDGFVIEAAGALAGIDMDMVGASMAVVLSGVEKMGTELTIKDYQALTFESIDATLICTPISDALLVIISSDSQKLGTIRFRSKALIPQLVDLF